MQNWRSRLTARFIAYALFIGTVAGVAAINSYVHMVTVATWAHQAWLLAHTIPLSVDGMLGVATLAMADDKANGRYPRIRARIAFWLGAGVSVAANVASTVVLWGVNWLAIGTTAWAPIALLAIVEILAHPGKAIKNPVRVAAGQKAWETRSAVPKKKAPRKPRAPRVRVPADPVAEIESLPSNAPVSPAVR
jgi:hypothetical protein